MSEVIDRIAGVLRTCSPMFDEAGHINGTVPGRGAWDCWCGEIVNATHDAVLAHVAEQVASELGLEAAS